MKLLITLPAILAITILVILPLICGNITGKMTAGNIISEIIDKITGHVTSNVTDKITGKMISDMTGKTTGKLRGKSTRKITGTETKKLTTFFGNYIEKVRVILIIIIEILPNFSHILNSEKAW